MPYAAKAVIQHEFSVNLLYIWLTFRHPMNQDLKPSLSLWLLECDEVPVDIVDSSWQDEFTLLLTSDTIASAPERVTLAYDGPDPNLTTTWGKQWEPWGSILSIDLVAYRQPCFFSRGNPDNWDFETSDFVTDGAWHNLDLSSIVPVGASAVLISGSVLDFTAGLVFLLREPGLADSAGAGRIVTQVSNIDNWFSFVVPLDTNRFISYYATNTTWTRIRMSVAGWFF